MVLLGSRHSAGTLNLREFLSRNGHPYTYVDLDDDRDSQALLDRFNVKASEVPVVICNTPRRDAQSVHSVPGVLPGLQQSASTRRTCAI